MFKNIEKVDHLIIWSISPWDSIKYTDNLSYVHIQHIDWPFHTFKNNIHNILGHSTDVIPAWEYWA